MRKEYDFSGGVLINPPQDPNKTKIILRLDTEVLDWFREQVHKAGGGSYQTLINDVLKNYISQQKSKLHDHR